MKSLRAQLSLTLGGIVVALVVVLSIVLGQHLSSTIRADVGKSMIVTAEGAQRVLSRGLHLRMVIVERLVALQSLWSDGLDSPRVRDAIAQQQLVWPNLAWIGVADKDGIVRASTGDLLRGESVAQRPWWKAGSQRAYVGDVHQAVLLAKLLPAARGGEPQRFVDFAAPIRVDGRVIGVLGLHGSWEWAREVIESLLPADAKRTGIEVFIFDRNGTVLYASPGQTPFASFPDIVTAESNAGQTLRWPDGKDYLTAVSSLHPEDAVADLGWRVAVRMPQHIADLPLHEAATTVILAGVIAAVLAVWLTWLAASRIGLSLAQIAQAASDVQHGKPNAHIPHRNDNREVTQLSEALIAMTTELEARVALRTRQLEEANEALANNARVDPLTGLLNRRGFDERRSIVVANARRRGGPLSLLAIDIDHFKSVNDRFGHAVGDSVLCALASTLRGRVRETDVVARMGGEEFTVILVDTTTTQARSIADALVRQVAGNQFDVVGRVTISCGVSAMEIADGGVKSLRKVDRALYAAKADGRNRVSFAETDEPAVVD